MNGDDTWFSIHVVFVNKCMSIDENVIFNFQILLYFQEIYLSNQLKKCWFDWIWKFLRNCLQKVEKVEITMASLMLFIKKKKILILQLS